MVVIAYEFVLSDAENFRQVFDSVLDINRKIIHGLHCRETEIIEDRLI